MESILKIDYFSLNVTKLSACSKSVYQALEAVSKVSYRQRIMLFGDTVKSG